MTPTDTPRTDVCLKCGSEEERPNSMSYLCGGWWPIRGEYERQRLCYALERAENAEADLIRTQIEMQLELDRAEAEVERLEEKLASLQGAYLKSCERDNNLTQEIFESKAEVERLNASVQHYQAQALHFQHAWEKVQAMYNKLIYTSTKPIEPQQDDK